MMKTANDMIVKSDISTGQNSGSQNSGSQNSASSMKSTEYESGSSDSDALGVAGVVIGTLGLIVGIGAVAYTYNKNSSSGSSSAGQTSPEQAFQDDPEAKSLGSK